VYDTIGGASMSLVNRHTGSGFLAHLPYAAAALANDRASQLQNSKILQQMAG